MKRKLASVQRVIDISPIEGADAIEAVRIQGWQCVVKKGTFAIGDVGAYFEIDAVPPDLATFRFLWTRKGEEQREGARPAKYRIRTMTLRGCLSQGLFMPLKELGIEGAWSDGDDLSEALGVARYDPPVPPGSGDLRAAYPGCVPRTDEMRVQSSPAVLSELRDLPYVITLKYDGTSATYLIDPEDGTFHACGRNWSIREGDNLYWAAARRLEIEARLREREGRYVVQGELCGPGIQKNPLGLKELSLFAFSVFDLRDRAFLSHDDAHRLLLEMNIYPVEVLEEGERFSHDQISLLRLAEGKYPGTTHEREGIVIRPRTERSSSTLAGRLSFKAISNRFLLAERD